MLCKADSHANPAHAHSARIVDVIALKTLAFRSFHKKVH
jgi:hypothetical protein